MEVQTNRTTTASQRRSQPNSATPRWGLGLAGFLVGLGVMSGLWWLGIGPRQTMSLFWLTSPDDVYYVEQERSFRATSLEEAIRASLQELIDGPHSDRLISTLPPNTRILAVRVEGDDIFLNFSPEFAGGGGSTTMLGRITQVLYTVTSQNETARVWISVNGKALTILGGEGLMLDQPLTRASFEPNFRNLWGPESAAEISLSRSNP
jgi:hypothetical protein